MNQSAKHIRLCAALLAVNLVIIWGNSLLPGNVSGAISDYVKEILAELLPMEGGASGNGGFLIRKLAHFTEFTCLGLLLSWFVAMKEQKKFWPFLAGTLVASVDETIQMFVPGRGPALADVGIDSCGVLFGMLVFFLIGKGIKKFGGNQL